MIVAALDSAYRAAFVDGLQVGLMAAFLSLAGMIGIRSIRKLLAA